MLTIFTFRHFLMVFVIAWQGNKMPTWAIINILELLRMSHLSVGKLKYYEIQYIDFSKEATICLWIKIWTSLLILAYLPLNIIYTHNGTYKICQNITIKPTQTSVLKSFYCKWKLYFSVHFPELHLHSNANSLYVYIQTWFLLFWCCQY